jgi:competence protein ComEA
MIDLAINERIIGFLVLLLILLLLYSLKPAFTYTKPWQSSCVEHFFIQVDGDIKFPGVYPFAHHPNWMELLGRAGGLRSAPLAPRASKDPLFPNGVKVMVNEDGQEWRSYQSQMSAFYKLTLGIPISLNGESEEGLTALPGIGLGLAKSIVQERSKRGGFRSLDEILSINGISHTLFKKIKPFLTL